MNTIIKNIQQLSRRERSNPEPLSLNSWIDKFIRDYIYDHNINANDINVGLVNHEISIYMDSTQLHQILNNLFQNGLYHSMHYKGQPKLKIQIGVDQSTEESYLEVLDRGPGIAPEIVQQIFEPFFTTESSGTGLGLYIASELCVANKARLNYKPSEQGSGCFRIDFMRSR